MGRAKVDDNMFWNEDAIAKEKLLCKGRSSLSDAELLSMFVEVDKGRSKIERAKEILSCCRNNLSELSEDAISILRVKCRLSEREVIQISSAVELASRIKLSSRAKVEVIRSNADVLVLMRPLLQPLRHEEFWVIYLNGSNRVLEYRQISIGGTDASLVDVKMVMSKAITLLATSIILVHNHPSGVNDPSEEDMFITEKIKGCCQIMDINLLDHIIIAGDSSLSFREKKIL